MSNLTAMLATELDEADCKSWAKANGIWAQQKMDGHRMMAYSGPEPLFLNRRGEPFKHKVPVEIVKALETLGGGWMFDGEFVAGQYVIFDCLTSTTGVTPADGYFHRHAALEALFTVWKPEKVQLIETAQTPNEKEELIDLLREQCAEGVIFRVDNADYTFGRSEHLRKVKFWKSVDVVVYDHRREDKNSVGVAVFNESGELCDIGAVTMTERRLAKVQEGDVIEVKYLYASDNMRLVQPAFMRIRTDKTPEECTLDQLVQTNKQVLR